MSDIKIDNSRDITSNSFSTNPKSSGHDCCSSQPKGKMECPKCSIKTKGVLEKTLNHLLTDRAKKNISCLNGFYFCKTPTCEVVYFRDNTLLKQKDISVIVGLKDCSVPSTVCYCFEWTKEKIKIEIEESGKTMAIEDIKAKMENIGCSCEILNPSGGCCLGDTSKAIKEIKSQLNIA